MAREENNSFSAAPSSGRSKATKLISNKNKNRVEFRLPDDEFWIHESMARSLFELGYIKNPSVNELARFCLNLYANDYMARGELLTKKLSNIIPLTYYEKLIRALEREKQCHLLYKKANETLAAALEKRRQTIDRRADHSGQKEENATPHAIPDQTQPTPANIGSKEETWKGQFIYIPGLRTGITADDYGGSSENHQA